MTVARQIPDAARIPQVAASDPEHSVFVSANAGSGKTHVLVQRVINLLLRGADPAKILCVTFTKAAAANMSIPTLMLFKNGEIASRQVGAAPKQKLHQWISGSV